MPKLIHIFCVLTLIFCTLAVTAKSDNSEQQIPRFEKSDCVVSIPKDEDVTCGYLTILEDRKNTKSQKTIRLPIIIMKSSSPNPEPDPILYTAGGPGASSLRQVNARQYIPYLKNRDYILFEQRGTKYARPALECPEINKAALKSVRQNLSTQQAVSTGIEAAKACRQRLEKEGINLSAYNSAESAADIEDLRKVLGYEEWNLYGVSYSTRLMLTVMRDHPEGIRSVLLDSVFPVSINYDETSVKSVVESAKKLFKTCQADAECNKAYPRIKKQFYDLVKQANKNPFAIDVKDEKVSIKITGVDLANELYDMLNSGNRLGTIPYFINEVSKGNKEVLEGIAKGYFGTSRLAWGMRYSHWCSEEMPFQSRAKILGQAKKYKGFKGFQTQPTLQSICGVWNVKPIGEKENKPVKSNIPTLIIAGKYDPNTPPKWGKKVAKNLSNSFFYELPDMSHVPTFSSGCALSLATDFFNDPNKTPKTNCAEKLSPPRFKVIDEESKNLKLKL